MAIVSVSTEADTQFRIAATEGIREPRARILKHDDTFAVLNDFGDMTAEPGSPDGLYHKDTRYLSQFELRLNGHIPLLLNSTPAEDNSFLPVDLANTDSIGPDGTPVHRELIWISRRQFIWRSIYYEALLLRNFDLQSRSALLTIRFAADFADIFEVRGQQRAERGELASEVSSPEQAVLRYTALDGVECVTTLSFTPVPTRLDQKSATFLVPLAAGAGCRLGIRVSCGSQGAADWNIRGFYRALRAERRELRGIVERAVSVEASNPIFNELTRRSLSDIAILSTATEHGPYPFAGIPWYSTPFGRDGIITALMTLWLDPAIAKGVLTFLAANQAVATDPERDAEPGKIVHEMRNGEMARLGEVPFGRYYGSVDATPLFVMLLGEYFQRTGDLNLVRRLWPNAIAALQWIDTAGDPDCDGLVEYDRRSATGLANQGWKDSADAIFHAGGELAIGPIALCEVQGYVFAAKRHAAAMARSLGDPATADRFHAEAEALRRKFEANFWCDELSTYALALDGDKRPCRVIASNAGHALLTGIAAPDRAERVAETLMRSASFSGWGVRTVDRTAARYNPISYHNGSVWPHDNALIALGCARYGLKEPVLRIFEGLFDAASHWEPRRLPELFCGFARRHAAPTLYPVACAPQAWASAAVFALMQASIGLRFDPAASEIWFDQPVLPGFLDRLHLRGLRLADCCADVLLQRVGGEVVVAVTRRQGQVRVVASH